MFESAKQKIHRAEYHISDIERQFAAFVAEKPHRFVSETDPETGDLLLRVRFLKEPPDTFSLVIGDAIHNLRCALDHAAWEIVGIDGGTQDRHLKFPTGDTRTNFEASCQGIKTPDQWVKDTFKITEAFAGGKGGRLYDLHQLDNADKHVAITPVFRATRTPRIRVMGPNGAVLMDTPGSIVVGGTEGVNLGNFGRGLTIKIQDADECTPSIFIEQGGGWVEPAIAFLKDAKIEVEATVQTLEWATSP